MLPRWNYQRKSFETETEFGVYELLHHRRKFEKF